MRTKASIVQEFKEMQRIPLIALTLTKDSEETFMEVYIKLNDAEDSFEFSNHSEITLEIDSTFSLCEHLQAIDEELQEELMGEGFVVSEG